MNLSSNYALISLTMACEDARNRGILQLSIGIIITLFCLITNTFYSYGLFKTCNGRLTRADKLFLVQSLFDLASQYNPKPDGQFMNQFRYLVIWREGLPPFPPRSPQPASYEGLHFSNSPAFYLPSQPTISSMPLTQTEYFWCLGCPT